MTVARGLSLLALIGVLGGARADELSGADKLRVVYSNQFSWTRDGLPIVTVRVMEHRPSVTLSGAGMRVVPDGEGGPEVRGGATWTVRVLDGKPGRIVTHNVVASFTPSQTDQLQAELAKWRAKKVATRTFETGALFAVKGQVLDSRRVLVAAAGTSGGRPFPELVERPRGTVEAIDEHGVVVRNDSILWFEPGPSGLIALADVDNEHGRTETRKYWARSTSPSTTPDSSPWSTRCPRTSCSPGWCRRRCRRRRRPRRSRRKRWPRATSCSPRSARVT